MPLVPELKQPTTEAFVARMDAAIRWAARLSLILAGSVVVNLILAVILAKLSGESMVQVQLVYLDPEGRELWTVKPDETTMRDGVILERLQEWVRWVRSRPAEPVKNQPQVKRDWARAFAMMAPIGKVKLEEFFRTADPLLEANRQTSIEVYITEVAQLAPLVYQISWRERHVDSRLRVIEEQKWTVRLPIQVRPPQTKVTHKEAKENALGIWIEAFVWWPQLENAAAAGREQSVGVRNHVDASRPPGPAHQ